MSPAGEFAGNTRRPTRMKSNDCFGGELNWLENSKDLADER